MNDNINNDPYQFALEQMQEFGLVIDSITIDGRIHRVKVIDGKPRKKDGWYVAHEFKLDDGQIVITGSFGNFKANTGKIDLKFNGSLSKQQKQEYKKKQYEFRDAYEKEKALKHKEAAKRAAEIFEKLPIDGKSKYLERKKIHSFGARYSRGSIVVPVQKDNKLTGLQFINPNGEKKFLTGTEKKGAYFKIDGFEKNSNTVIVCEGYATGCTIASVTGFDVYVAFDANNLINVVKYLYPIKSDVVIAADNDHRKTPNTGLETAYRIQKEFPKVRIAIPNFPPGDSGTDFNDLAISQSPLIVKDIICAPRPKPKKQPDLDWESQLIRKPSRGGEGGIEANLFNTELILRNDPELTDSLAYNDFSYRLIKQKAPILEMDLGEWEDADTSRLRIWFMKKYGFEPSEQMVSSAILVVAKSRRFHPVRDYLKSTKWDGINRLDHWIEDTYQISSQENMQYVRLVGRKFLISAVARIMKPGCKVDTVFIIEGAQGIKKSTSISILFGEWFSDAPIPIGEKDAYQNIQGVWCNELAELDSFNKAESTSAKLFFSQVRDRYRVSYGRHAQDFPRQTVFVGTTNQEEYLKDYTGNRRYWPIKVKGVDLNILKDQRDQLWAEALHYFEAGEQWWPDDHQMNLFTDAQYMRMQLDPWHHKVEEYIQSCELNTTKVNKFRIETILKDVIGIEPHSIKRPDQNRVADILRDLGYKRTKSTVNGKRLNVFVKK